VTAAAPSPNAAGPGHARSGRGRAALLPLAILLLISLFVLPVPTLLLDILFISNILISLLVLMVAINAKKPLDFSSFPTVLLFATLLRLALNVASTRVVLVQGHTGVESAGQVIHAFGEFLIGGDYIVGLFVFAILVIINLTVITKGAGRVSEVSARFTLDALPGKQMAIDADLNAGLMTPAEAKARRQEVATEADFYGSMDGASKFVKGDAVAGLLILAMNIFGGLLLGTLKHDLSLSDAASIYIVLAIGDGLVAQVPSLLLSIAAAMIVTRVSSTQDLTGQLGSELNQSKSWMPVAWILLILGVVPGMPHFIILPIATFAAYIAWKARTLSAVTPEEAEAIIDAPLSVDTDIDWESVSDHVQISVDIGFGLIRLVDERLGAPLMARITGIRQQLSKELGFVIPMVRVRDNIGLPPNAYRISIGGVVCGEDILYAHEWLALESDLVHEPLSGKTVIDPSFGLPAVWLPAERKDLAIAAGYTVVDASTVAATHLNRIVIAHAADIFGQQETQKLLELLQQNVQQLAAGLVPKALSLQQLTTVLQGLLQEQVPIRDFRRIAEVLCSITSVPRAPHTLLELTRKALGGLIIQKVSGMNDTLHVVTFASDLEQLLVASVRADVEADNPFDPVLARRLTESFLAVAQDIASKGILFAVVTAPVTRRAVYFLLKTHLPDVTVLSFLEIPDTKNIQIMAVIGQDTLPSDPAILQAA
jgi:flagellar biosynthesis protein FlhA